jgi:hypothetical protein
LPTRRTGSRRNSLADTRTSCDPGTRRTRSLSQRNSELTERFFCAATRSHRSRRMRSWYRIYPYAFRTDVRSPFWKSEGNCCPPMLPRATRVRRVDVVIDSARQTELALTTFVLRFTFASPTLSTRILFFFSHVEFSYKSFFFFAAPIR